MHTRIHKIQQVIEKLQEIVDKAERCDTDEVVTSCNTYGLHEFISFGSDGYLNLNADIDELVDAPEFDDDMP